MKRRVFIALPIPPEVARAIESVISNPPPLFPGGVRFLPREQWHLTLSFLGDQDDEAIGSVVDVLGAFAAETASPKIDFAEIIYGPPGKRPRLIWAVGTREASDRLGSLRDTLEEQLVERGVRFQPDHHRFTTHLTLARFTDNYAGPFPSLARPLTTGFSAERIEFLESTLIRSGPTYDLLSSFAFRDDA